MITDEFPEETVSRKATAPDLSLLFLRQGEGLRLEDSHASASRFEHNETPIHFLGQCLCGLAASHGHPLYSKDIHRDDRCTWKECKKTGLRSFAALPLRGREGIIGVLGLASATERDFEQQAPFLETLADEAARGSQNAWLHQETRELAFFNQSMVERMAEGIVLQDTRGRFTFINPAAARMLDYTQKEMLDMHWTEVIPLAGLGYTVTPCSSSLKALELFRADPDAFDLLITDLTMPEMTGLELVQEIQHIRPRLPVLLCSGFCDQISPEAAKARGIRAFLNKPLIGRDLAEAIRKVLD